MHKDFHIPMPKFEATETDRSWVMHNIAPRLYPALKLIKGAFDRVDIPQQEFMNWPQREAVLAHFDEMELHFKRFACFISQPNQNPKTAHIDAFMRGTPMVARFNIPIQGISPVSLCWWNDDVNSDKIDERVFTELRNGKEATAYSYRSTIDDWGNDPVYRVENPNACWNRTDVAHRAQGPNCNESRIIITAEIATQVPWHTLVVRLEKLNYC